MDATHSLRGAAASERLTFRALSSWCPFRGEFTDASFDRDPARDRRHDRGPPVDRVVPARRWPRSRRALDHHRASAQPRIRRAEQLQALQRAVSYTHLDVYKRQW